MKTTIINILVSAFALLVSVDGSSQRKYEDLYNSLPDKSLDQSFDDLLIFQRTNPTFPNTYIQLGMICEHKMILTDPLRDIETAQHWSNNAHLFFGNFKGFYKEGDVRSNDEYYENLNIPHAGKRVTDEELMKFVEEHEAKCKNFMDSTLMIYNAIEKAKAHYNSCIATFYSLCEKYPSYNELLLAYDESIDAALNKLSADMKVCVESFAEYKGLISKYPILNYRQLYDLKTIETFRLDGLTNSDFYANRFTMWDFAKWIADYRKVVNESILPLREAVASIDNSFNSDRKEYLSGEALSGSLVRHYDDYFFFRLGKYDNNSLVRELFKFRESVRQLTVLSRDSLALNVDSSASLMNRKMRHIYRMSQSLDAVKSGAVGLKNFVTDERVARFAKFFSTNYGGAEGVGKFAVSESSFCDGMLSNVLNDFASYSAIVDSLRSKSAFSVKTKLPSLPLWPVSEAEVSQVNGNYITTRVAYDAYGRPVYVAGYKKGGKKGCFVARISADNTTGWIVDIKKAQDIRDLYLSADGCVVSFSQNALPVMARFSETGSEIQRFDISDGALAFADYNDITRKYHMAFNGGNDYVDYNVVDSLGAKAVAVQLADMSEALAVQPVSGGVLVVGTKAGNIVLQPVTDEGVLSQSTIIKGNSLVLISLFRASAHEMCIFLSDADGRSRMVIVGNDGVLKWSSL